jgi:hypothetical protein
MDLTPEILAQLPLTLRVEIEENALRKSLTQSELAESGTPVVICIVEEDSGAILWARLRDIAPLAQRYQGKRMGAAGMVFFPRSAFRKWTRVPT